MKYLGKDLREGMRLVASSDITSNTASVSMTNVFKPERLYYINVMDFRPNNDQRTLQYRWLDGSDNAISITNYHESGLYGASGGNGSTGAVYSTNRTAYVNTVGGVGNASDEHGMFELWCVPNTANEKLAFGSGAFHSGTDEDYSARFVMASRLNTSATRAEGIQWVVDSNTGGHQLNNATIRIYEMDSQKNLIPNIHQKRHGVNWVKSKYLGETPKGQGWAKIKELTASDGDSALDFEDIFTSNYLRYYIVGTDCRPATDNKNLIFQYRDATGLVTNTYASSFHSSDANGSTGQGHADDQTVGLVLNAIGNTGNEVGHFTCFLDPVTTNTPKHLMYRSVSQMRDTYTRYITGHVAQNEQNVMTGIKWYWSSGNWESGKITIYGVEHK